MRKMSMPASAACSTKRLHHVVGVVGVADGVGARSSIWKQMLGISSRSALQPLPGVLHVRKRIAVSKVAPPHISREKSSGEACAVASAIRQHVVGAHARRQERLVRVAKRGVGDEQPLLLLDPLRRSSSGPSRPRICFVPSGYRARRSRPRARCGVRNGRLSARSSSRRRPFTVTLADEAEELRAPVALVAGT